MLTLQYIGVRPAPFIVPAVWGRLDEVYACRLLAVSPDKL
jgi:hypothetical protein